MYSSSWVSRTISSRSLVTFAHTTFVLDTFLHFQRGNEDEPKNEDDHKNDEKPKCEGNLKKEDNLKNEEDLKDEEDLKNEDDLKNVDKLKNENDLKNEEYSKNKDNFKNYDSLYNINYPQVQKMRLTPKKKMASKTKQNVPKYEDKLKIKIDPKVEYKPKEGQPQIIWLESFLLSLQIC